MNLNGTNNPFQKKGWAGVSLEKRQHYMAHELHVNHPALTKTISEIERRMQRCANEQKSSGMMVLSPSGAGKTHLSNLLKERWPDAHEGDVSNVPVITFATPLSLSKREMGKALLKAAGDPAWEKGTAASYENRIQELLPQIGTKLIVIDNAHDIPDKRRERGIIEVGNWIRDLIDAEKINSLVVLLGTHALRQVVQNNIQLRRRVACQMEIPHFDPVNELPRFMRFMHEIDKKLPLAEMSGLKEKEMARRMGWASYGVPDYIFQILNEAVSEAFLKQREKILLGDLERAFDLVFQDAGKGINPFKEKGPKRVLDHEGEPFHNFYDRSSPDPSKSGE